MRCLVFVALFSACATALPVPEKFVSERDAAHPPAKFLLARGLNADLTVAEEAAKAAVSAKISSSIKSSFKSLVSEVSTNGLTKDQQDIFSSVESSSAFGHAELIDIVDRFQDRASGQWYALAALDRARGEAALEAELRAPLQTFEAAYAQAKESFEKSRYRAFRTHKHEVLNAGPKAIAGLLQIAGVQGHAKEARQDAVVDRMTEIAKAAVTLKERALVLVVLHAARARPGVEPSVLADVVSQALTKSGLRVTSERVPDDATPADPKALSGRSEAILAYVDLDTETGPSDFGEGMYTARTAAQVTVMSPSTREELVKFDIPKSETKEVMPSEAKAARKSLMHTRDLLRDHLDKALSDVF